MSRQFVIIGLGRLGSAMLDTLLSLGHEVLGIDLDEDLVQELSSEHPHAHLVVADATEESVLRDLNVAHFDGAAVVIGENMEAGILATANLKELGVPFVVARAISKLHGRVLERIGADRIIEPERDMGAQVARTMSSPAVMDYVDLGEDEALIEAEVPKEWVGKSLADLHLSRESGLTILAIKPKGKAGTIPSGDTVLNEGDVIVVGGTKDALDRSPLVRSEGR
ncbi:MAG TPA: TrkA family potassium uptake protein [Rubrobacteraceae bacterium]|nr:TrkA family potassium uptake protein [Rubrobacteraceae bacterium]